nr:hypothetical protein [Sulfitobacter sp. SK011]
MTGSVRGADEAVIRLKEANFWLLRSQVNHSETFFSQVKVALIGLVLTRGFGHEFLGPITGKYIANEFGWSLTYVPHEM